MKSQKHQTGCSVENLKSITDSENTNNVILILFDLNIICDKNIPSHLMHSV